MITDYCFSWPSHIVADTAKKTKILQSRVHTTCAIFIIPLMGGWVQHGGWTRHLLLRCIFARFYVLPTIFI